MEDNFDRLMNAPEGEAALDFTVFNDPLASHVSWIPMNEEGNGFTTHKLQQISTQALSFRPSIWVRIFPLLFVAVGCLLIVIAMVDAEASANVMLYVGILLFWGGAALMADKLISTVTFDKEKGLITAQRWLRAFLKRENGVRKYPLQEVHAIQIIAERIKEYEEDSNRVKGTYKSYEINLVLKDHERVHVLDHTQKEQIMEEAQMLANFLGIHIWNQADAQLLEDEHQ